MSSEPPQALRESRFRTEDAVCTGTRALSPQEQAELLRRGSRQTAAGCALLFPVPFLFLGFLIALAMISEPDGRVRGSALAVMVLMLICVPLMLIQGYHWFRQGGELRRDARRGEVYRFERAPTADASADDRRAESGPFEVLPTSRIIWRGVSGNPAQSEQIEFTEVAETPERAATAAEWTQPVDPVQAPGLQVNHRELTPAERDELGRQIRRTAWGPLRAAVPLTLWVGTVLVLAWREGRLPTGYHQLSFWLLCLVMVLADLGAVAGLLTAWKLYRDRLIGRVVIVRMSQAVGPGPGGSRAGELSPPSEFLPYSRRRWTVAGEPDAWRV